VVFLGSKQVLEELETEAKNEDKQLAGRPPKNHDRHIMYSVAI
jgi:hypothetical protein